MMLLLILFATGMFAGMVDAIAGGGGLISVPILFSVGVPPHLVLGTNKLQGIVGTFNAALKFHRHGLIKKEPIYSGLIYGLIGAALGAIVAQSVSSELLRKIAPVLLILVLAYSIFSPKLGHLDQKPRMQEGKFYFIFGLLLGFYDGFFGPATGSFWVFGLTFFLGYNLIKATAYTKVFNLNSSLIATIFFATSGNIDYKIACCMACGQLIGSRLGAHLAIKNGARLIRPFFLCVVSITISTMFYKAYSSSDLFVYITEQYGILPQFLVGIGLLTSLVIFSVLRMRKMNRP